MLVHKKGLVKTTKFSSAKYVGDPINAVRIFNEKEVDELIVLDIDASVNGTAPDFDMIKNLATECRMPLCYGGGIKTVEQAQKIFSLGVEKIAISSLAVEQPQIITDLVKRVGSQSVVVVVDAKKKLLSSKYEVYIHNAKKSTGIDVIEFAKQLELAGVGEIVVNSIDQDGLMKGYDMDLLEKVRNVVSIPTTFIGGAGTLDDVGKVISRFGIVGVAAGSLFVFKGKFRAVLINYPTLIEKRKLIEDYFLNKWR